MPRGNGTGPAGMGPMTGRGAGYCAGFGLPGYARFGGGGMGFGRGPGRGFARGVGLGNVPAEVERWNLERRAEFLEEELKALKDRLSAIEGKGEEA